MLDKVDDQEDQKSKQEKAHAERLLKRIKSFKQPMDERAKGWKLARDYADGDPNGDDDKGLVRTNLIGSVLETLQPSIYAKAPEIAVTLDESSDTSEYALIKPFTETLQNALNRFLVKDGKLKIRGKSAVRSAITTTIGWVKVIYQVSKTEDPVTRNRINDTQDNVQRLEVLIKETQEEGGACDEYEAKLFELKQQISGLEAQLEVVSSEGLVLDTIPTEDIIVLDDSCRDIDEFMQAGAIAHRIKMTVGAFKEQFKKDPPNTAKLYTSDTDANEQNANVDGEDKLLYIYEVWSMADMTVYTLLEGSAIYVREPYQPTKLGQQWYPFFGLQLRRVDGKRYPKSTVEQLIELQDEYNTRRTNSKEHRKKNVPVRLINKASGITDEEIKAINNRSVNDDMIGVSADPNTPIQAQLGSLPEIPYNPLMYDTSDILFDMEKVGNTQDAASGAIRIAKTATEAEIASAGMQGRTGESLDVIEDWLTDIATYSAQLLLQNTSPETIAKHFGQKSVWPVLSKDEYFNMIKISIRAGSTARPNKMRERDQWIQLLPIIEGSIDKLIMAKQSGQKEVAETIIALLDETLHRFDERLDAKELLGISEEQEQGEQQLDENGQPIPPEGEEADKPVIPPEVEEAIQQMQQQAQEQIQSLTQENQAIKQALENKEREYSLKDREVAIKERDIALKEEVAIADYNKENVNTEATEQVTQVTSELLQQSMEANTQMLETLNQFMVQLAEMQAPKRKVAKAVRQPDGSYIMESEEV